MKTITNNKYNFSFEINENWETITRNDNNGKLFAPSTLYYFTRNDENDKKFKITINIESTNVSDINEFNNAINENIKHLQMAFGQDTKISLSYKNMDKFFVKYYIQCPIYNAAMYFVLIDNLCLIITGIIDAENDNADNEILKIIHSLKINKFRHFCKYR